MSELSELLERNHFKHRCSICRETEAELRKLREESTQLDAVLLDRNLELAKLREENEAMKRCDCGRELGRGLCSVCDNDE